MVNLGNHSFDRGPTYLSDYFEGIKSDVIAVSSNLDFTEEPALVGYVDEGFLVPYTIVKKQNVKIGVIGGMTENLDSISNPGENIVIKDLLESIEIAENKLAEMGVKIIVLAAHLLSINNDIELAQ